MELGPSSFLAGWLCAWTIGGVAAGVSLFRHFSFFICVWMIGGPLENSWLAIPFCTRSVDERSREVVLVNSESLTCATQIFGMGRAKSYRVGEISDPRFQSEVMAGKSRMPSRIAFDYETKVFGFGAGIEEAEAAELISRIRQRCGIAEASTRQGSGIKFWRPR